MTARIATMAIRQRQFIAVGPRGRTSGDDSKNRSKHPLARIARQKGKGLLRPLPLRVASTATATARRSLVEDVVGPGALGLLGDDRRRLAGEQDLHRAVIGCGIEPASALGVGA